MRRSFQFLFFAIFFISTFLRITLAIVNREANDEHMEVVQLILQQRRLPEYNDCWECFQPKLYYAMVALIVRAAGLYSGQITPQIIITAQLLNAFLGSMLILLVRTFIRSLPMENEPLKIIAIALVAFNPSFLGINGQATNDTLAIFLSTLAIYSALLFLRKEKTLYLLACIFFVLLGLAAKTIVMITAGAIIISFLVKSFIHKQRFMLFSSLVFILSIAILSFLNPLTQYKVNQQKYGSLATMNTGIYPAPFPHFFEKSYFRRPGVVSIQDGIFTFKYINLLEYPRLTNDEFNYPAHRTSLWTQLYGHAHSIHFDNWPPTWGSTGNEYFTLTRAIYLLALLPTGLLLIGVGLDLAEFLAALARNSLAALAGMDYGLFTMVFWGYIVFIMLYSLLYRDYSMMKTIFIYPALLVFVTPFIESTEMIQHALKGNKWFMAVLSTICAVLIILYAVDIASLTLHLSDLLT